MFNFYQETLVAVGQKFRAKLSTGIEVVNLGPETDYGFFLPTELGSKSGIWLDVDKRLEDYMRDDQELKLKSGVRP